MNCEQLLSNHTSKVTQYLFSCSNTFLVHTVSLVGFFGCGEKHAVDHVGHAMFYVWYLYNIFSTLYC